MNVRELEQRFPNDAAVVEWLIDELHGGSAPCRHCGSERVTRLDDRKFRCRDCHKKFSVLTGTIFEKTRQPLTAWLHAILRLSTNARKGVSSCELARDLGIPQKSAWRMLSKIRKAMAQKNAEIGPLSRLVECDEMYIGGKARKNNCKWINVGPSMKTPVITMVERPAEGNPGRARAFAGERGEYGKLNQTGEQVRELIAANVDLEVSEVHTDESPLYKGLNKTGAFHESVTHNRRYVAEGGHVHINTAESFHALPKRSFYGIYHKYERTQEYVDEAVYRWNHRKEEQLFAICRVLELATTAV